MNELLISEGKGAESLRNAQIFIAIAIRNHEVASSNLASSSNTSRISRKKWEIRYFFGCFT